MRLSPCIIGLILMFVSSTAFAEGTFDGTKTLLCASIEAIDCVPGTPCDRDLPDVIGAPQFITIDFKGQKIIGPNRTTPVLHQEKSDAQILLQGIELDMGWVFVLDRLTGKFSASLTNKGGAFVIFGACTEP